MRHKKKQKKKPTRPVITPEEEAVASKVVKDLLSTGPKEIKKKIPDSRHACLVIERLPVNDSTSLPILSAIGKEFKDKVVRKAMGKAIYKLKRNGVSIEESVLEKRPPAFIFKPEKKEDPVGFLGPIDLTGSRAILILFNRAVKGQDIGIGIVSDEAGMHQFFYDAVSKKRSKEMQEYFTNEAGPLIQTSLAHATAVLETAYKYHQSNKTDAPEAYLEIRPWLLEKTVPLDHPAIYDVISKDLISNDILTSSQLDKLFSHELMSAWFVDFNELKPFIDEMKKLEDSPIVLTDAQKVERSQEIKKNGLNTIFPLAKRSLLKQRLEEMAYFFYKQDEKEFARLCLIAAQYTEKETSLIQENLVTEFIFTRSCDFYAEEADDGTEGGSEDNSVPSLILP